MSERFEPVPDDPAGNNNPYRGTENHGVQAPQGEPTDEGYWRTGRPAEFLPEEKEIDPVLVRVVQETRKERRCIRTALYPLNPGDRLSVIGRDETRTAVKLKAYVDTANPFQVFTGDAQVGSASGFPLGSRTGGAGSELSLTTTEPVFVFAPSTNTEIVNVAILVEYVQAVR